MNEKHVGLWQKLEQFQLDSPEASLPFSARLARENNWSPAYTQRVIAEYKRFAFLATAAGHPVSPSHAVDQVWHLHLTYSENYWRIFCQEILGQPLHHQPTQRGDAERNKFEDWYGRTLESYKTFFGRSPPSDIWPRPEDRKNEKQNLAWVDRERNWVIPKPRFDSDQRGVAAVLLVPLSMVCCGAMMAQGMNVFDWRGPDFLIFYMMLLAVTFGGALWVRRALRVPAAGRPNDAPNLDGYALAFLNGGRILAVNAAIANLIRQKALRMDARRKRLYSLLPEPAFSHELERRVYVAAEGPEGNEIGNIRLSAKSAVTKIADDLAERGLVVSERQAAKARVIPLLLVAITLAVGAIKIVTGSNRGKPVGYLLVLCVISFVLAMIAFARRPLRSRYGDAVLEQSQKEHVGPRRVSHDVGAIPAAEFATVVGLFGMTTLAGTELADLRKSLNPQTSVSCGSSCGGSSGAGCGGGCGGGGGGCGGCSGGGS